MKWSFRFIYVNNILVNENIIKKENVLLEKYYNIVYIILKTV